MVDRFLHGDLSLGVPAEIRQQGNLVPSLFCNPETQILQIDTVIDMICALEAREDPSGSDARIQEIRSVASRVTHM